ncbi:TIGR04255 family protein [uncultured Pseudoteredinibacter sp.]|uniref:TIGR04255 family protein n=1 Tax=uncultured Pseudoteredinibacter sp. TaxID=1641701 RepID=UPI00261D14C0|nr:TIGR04255 family protein [uncultured Pseudoteredinibacter sp.]
MSGRFETAPLVYVTAKLSLSPLNLTQDQLAQIQQGLLGLELVHFEKSVATQIDINGETGIVEAEVKKSSYVRHAFMSRDKSRALILDQNSFEYRVTKYTKYREFIEEFLRCIEVVSKLVEISGMRSLKECQLSYVDVVVPIGDRSLKDYFKSPDAILPLAHVENSSDELQFGQNQAIRLVDLQTRVNIMVEQLPANHGVNKFMPEQMGEDDDAFVMPLTILPHVREYKSERGHYALLLTQAAALLSGELVGDHDIKECFRKLHVHVKDSFEAAINRDVCDEDWRYVAE